MWKDKETQKEYNQLYYQRRKKKILEKTRRLYFTTKKPCPKCGEFIAKKSTMCISCTLKERNKTSKQRKAVSKRWAGEKREEWTEERKEEQSKRLCGVNRTPEQKLEYSLSKTGDKNPQWGRRGKEAGNWRGGKMAEMLLLRRSFEYKEWREKVFERDNYTCQNCGDKQGRNLEAHHIKDFVLYPELRFEVSNGLTLCKKCHKKTENWGMKGKKIVYTNGRQNPKIIEDVENAG